METIDFEVRLFDTTSLAADGSNIPRRSCEAYLQSADYQTIIRDKVAVGGMSHKDRKLRPELKGVIGMDDQVLINDNALFYITKLYFKEGDNFLYARARTFDPDLFAGARADNIKNLIGLLESGVRMPVSVVIQALWSKRGVAERIIRIKGFDFTQNPSFKGAGDIKIFSEVIQDENESEMAKSFSDTEGDLITKSYSTESVISILNENANYSTADNTVRLLYDITSNFSEENPNDVPTETSSDKNKKLLDYWYNYLKQYVTDENWFDQKSNNNKTKILNTIHEVQKSNSGDDNTKIIAFQLKKLLRISDPNGIDDLDNQGDTVSYSSVPSTIADRVLIDRQPRFTKIDRIIETYRKYWNQSKLTEEQKHKCKLLLIQDLSYLMKSVVEEIYDGKTFNQLYALDRFGKNIKEAGLTLSKSYRKLLISEKTLKFIPKAVYAEWLLDARHFYNTILEYAFNEGLPDIEYNLLKL